jgi:predicted permease
MNLLQDLRQGLRMLRTNPAYSAVAVAILALGIGANSVIFTVINEAFLRPVPAVADQSQLVGICFAKSNDCQGFSHPEYLDLVRASRVFSGLIAFEGTSLNMRGEGASAAESIAATLVSENYFDVLGVRPILGRTFAGVGTQPVAVLSEPLWRGRFAGNRAILGSTIVLNGAPFQVLGIAPPGFAGTTLLDRTDLWIPLSMEARARPLFPALDNRLFHTLSVIGRLTARTTLEQAQGELDVIGPPIIAAIDPGSARQSLQEKPQGLIAWSGIRMSRQESANAWEYVRILVALSALILVIACANVANLLLAAAARRRREIAVRLALGATRARIVRQLLMEGLLLGTAAGSAGFCLSLWTSRLLGFISWARQIDLTPDYRVLLGTFILSLLAAILFSLAPALEASKPDLVAALKNGVAGSGQRSRLRGALVIVQMALCVVLLTGAGLCVRTLLAIRSVDPGFVSGNTLVVPVDLRPLGYAEARARQLQRQLLARVAVLPGVEHAVLAASPPVGWSFGRDVIVETGKPQVSVDANTVTPGYFELLRIPILRGRDFTGADAPCESKAAGKDACPALPQVQASRSFPVAIVNEAMARLYWPDRDATDQSLRLVDFFGPGPPIHVIGVVGDTRRDLTKDGAPQLYLPLAQQAEASTVLLVRATHDPLQLIPAVRRQLLDLDPDVAAGDIATLDQRLAESVGESRENAILVGALGLLALILAATGLYAVMSYSVTQRTHEIGIRMALGAGRRDVLRLVVRQGMRLVLLGDVVGIAVAAGLARFMESLLYQVKPVDAVTYAGVTAVLAVVALVASLTPALRATRVDPLVALRQE